MTTPLFIRAAEIIEREAELGTGGDDVVYEEMLDIARQLRERQQEEDIERAAFENIARGPIP